MIDIDKGYVGSFKIIIQKLLSCVTIVYVWACPQAHTYFPSKNEEVIEMQNKLNVILRRLGFNVS